MILVEKLRAKIFLAFSPLAERVKLKVCIHICVCVCKFYVLYIYYVHIKLFVLNIQQVPDQLSNV